MQHAGALVNTDIMGGCWPTECGGFSVYLPLPNPNNQLRLIRL